MIQVLSTGTIVHTPPINAFEKQNIILSTMLHTSTFQWLHPAHTSHRLNTNYGFTASKLIIASRSTIALKSIVAKTLLLILILLQYKNITYRSHISYCRSACTPTTVATVPWLLPQHQ